MQTIPHTLRRYAVLASLAALAWSTLPQAFAADANGKWTWTVPGRNGGPDRKNTLTLKVEGEKLTGKVASPGRDGAVNETAIEEGKLAGSEVSFKVTREFNGNKMVAVYKGKLEGDTIKGKAEIERNGEKNSRDWEAKREVEKK